MTNPLKGQIEVTLGSETYKCRLTIDSLVKIEDELDQGILELAQNISQAKVRIRTLLVVLRYALRGGGNDFDEKQVGQIISDIGIVVASTEVAKLLVATLNNNDSDEEDKKKELE
jgi:hypothetical protein